MDKSIDNKLPELPVIENDVTVHLVHIHDQNVEYKAEYFGNKTEFQHELKYNESLSLSLWIQHEL